MDIGRCSLPMGYFTPKYLPTISGKFATLFLTDITPAAKSCTPPRKIPPRVIQTKAIGQYAAPRIAPKIGPSPTMLRN